MKSVLDILKLCLKIIRLLKSFGNVCSLKLAINKRLRTIPLGSVDFETYKPYGGIRSKCLEMTLNGFVTK